MQEPIITQTAIRPAKITISNQLNEKVSNSAQVNDQLVYAVLQQRDPDKIKGNLPEIKINK